MKSSIIIYGTGKIATGFVRHLQLIRDYIEIVCFAETTRNKTMFEGKRVINATEICKEHFSYLFIATAAYEEIVTYLKEEISVYDQIGRNKIYIVAMVENDLCYLTKDNDRVIGKYMACSGRNWSETLINAFFDLSERYYGIKKSRGIFLDVGANIGTTAIYVKKVINSSLRVIGIEAWEENYELFKANCYLNGVENIEAVFALLSNISNSVKIFGYNTENPGGSGIIETAGSKREIKELKTTTVDDYLLMRNISPETVDYLWVDVEGHEPEIIEGAMNLLKNKKVPLLQEFTPVFYMEKGCWVNYLNNIQKVYSNFIDVNEYLDGKDIIYSIRELKSFGENMKKKQTDIFLY